jgi:hypothetical protein
MTVLVPLFSLTHRRVAGMADRTHAPSDTLPNSYGPSKILKSSYVSPSGALSAAAYLSSIDRLTRVSRRSDEDALGP